MWKVRRTECTRDIDGYRACERERERAEKKEIKIY